MAESILKRLRHQGVLHESAASRRPRLVSLLCSVLGFDLTSRSPNLLRRDLPANERLDQLQPISVELRLEVRITPENLTAIQQLTRQATAGQPVILYVEAPEP